jgi:hypothetical protein
MPNPWDKQPRQATRPPAPELPGDAVLGCPTCGQPTDSLKQFRYVSWVVFYLAGASWQTAHYQACPSCMRRLVGGRMAWNLLPANVLWPVVVLPWGLRLIAESYRKGHSPEVLRQVMPEEAARQAAANDLSWGRVLAVLAVLLCCMPVLGLLFTLPAYLVNRKAADWRRRASAVALAVSVVFPLALLALMLASQ